MAHRQYLKKIDPLVQYPPITYCPANGHIPDPKIYVPDPDTIPTTNPPIDGVTLICTSEGYGFVTFSVTMTAGGSFKFDVYGAGNALVYTETKGGGTITYYFNPAQGKLDSKGVPTFRIEIYSTDSLKHITFFGRAVSAYGQDYSIIEAVFNTPYITSMTNAMQGIKSLAKVTFLSTMDVLTNMTSAFSACENLLIGEVPSSTSLLTLTSTFGSCLNMNILHFNGALPNVNSISAMANSSGLKTVTLPETMPALNNMQQTFENCVQLKYLKIPVNSAANISLVSTCSGCIRLVELDLVNEKLGNIPTVANNCAALKKVTLPTVANSLSNITSAFAGCSVLDNVTLPASLPALTTCPTAFQNCKKLKTLVMPTSAPLMTACNSMITGCLILTSITLPSDAINITTMAAFGAGNTSMTFAVLPPTLDYCTNISTAFFNCSALTSITMPTSMARCTTAESMAQNAVALLSLTMPASMPLATTIASVVYGCTALAGLTLPLSLPALTAAGFTQILFGCVNCTSISTCVFPAGVQFDCNYMGYTTKLTSFNQPTLRAIRLVFLNNGTVGTLNSVNIDWSNSTFTVASQTIVLRYGNMDATELNRIMTALPTVVGKQLDIRDNPGYATCTKTIATAKGWTVL